VPASYNRPIHESHYMSTFKLKPDLRVPLVAHTVPVGLSLFSFLKTELVGIKVFVRKASGLLQLSTKIIEVIGLPAVL